jgi:RNA polymerase sigma-70 factor (ECF subfamily)
METSAVTNSEGVLLEELGWLRTLARRLVADPNDAEDVVQEAWLRTREVVERFPSRGRLRAWLAGLAYRMARDTVRARRRRERREEIAALSARQDAEDGVERLAALESLLHTVRMLDEPLRVVVLLRYLDGHSTGEIASALEISEGLVRKRLSRGRAVLRRALGASEEPGERALGGGIALGTGLLIVSGLVAGLWLTRRKTPDEPVELPPVAVEASVPAPAVLTPDVGAPLSEAPSKVIPDAPPEPVVAEQDPVANDPATASPKSAPFSSDPPSEPQPPSTSRPVIGIAPE